MISNSKLSKLNLMACVVGILYTLFIHDLLNYVLIYSL